MRDGNASRLARQNAKLLNGILGIQYVNLLSTPSFQGFSTGGGFPYSSDFGDTEKSVNFVGFGATSCRLKMSFTAVANHKYLVMVAARITTPNPPNGTQATVDVVTGTGTASHPVSLLSINDTNGNGLYKSPSVGNAQASLSITYCHAACIYACTTDETATIQLQLLDTTNTVTFAYKDLMIVDITNIYTQSAVQALVNYGYFQGSVPFTSVPTDINALSTRVVTLESGTGSSYDPLWGKKLATAGDSITEGAMISADPVTGIKMTYGGIIATNHKMTYYNYGIGGSTLSNVAGKNPFVAPARYQNMAANIDYLTIFFGWNDNAYSTLGTITDTVDTTYFGAWNTVLPWLISHYPNTKIGLVVPYGCTVAMRQGVRDIAKKYGLKCLDLYADDVPMFFDRESTVDSATRTARQTAWLADGVHPNNAGYTYLATIFENFLRSL